MKIKLWGVRGSIPTPLQGRDIEDKIRKALSLAKPGDILSHESIESYIRSLPFSIRSAYGGNTTTLQVTTDAGDVFIIDCGTGVKDLGKELMKGEFGKGRGVGYVFFTHTHWDHIQGIPFFVPFYVEGNRFNIYSPIPDLRKRLEYQQMPTHFPIVMDYMPSKKYFYLLEKEEELFLNDICIFNKAMPHPGGAYAYRFEENGKTFVYTSDCEFNIESIDQIENYRRLFENADVVVFDTQYTFEESIEKFDWGHSSASIAIDIAGIFKFKKLVLFHHDPYYDDEKLEKVLFNARTYLSMRASKIKNLQIDIAYEGMEIKI